MPTTNKKKKTASGNGKPATRLRKTRAMPTEHDIAFRAYERFVERGGEHGHDREDWLVAERELRPPNG